MFDMQGCRKTADQHLSIAHILGRMDALAQLLASDLGGVSLQLHAMAGHVQAGLHKPRNCDFPKKVHTSSIRIAESCIRLAELRSSGFGLLLLDPVLT